MTLGFERLLYLLPSFLRPVAQRQVPPLDLGALGARDIADLNLPPGVAGRLMARREADEMRRRLFA